MIQLSQACHLLAPVNLDVGKRRKVQQVQPWWKLSLMCMFYVLEPVQLILSTLPGTLLTKTRKISRNSSSWINHKLKNGKKNQKKQQIQYFHTNDKPVHLFRSVFHLKIAIYDNIA